MNKRKLAVLIIPGIALVGAAVFTAAVTLWIELKSGGGLQEEPGRFIFLKIALASFLVSLSIVIPAAALFRKDAVPLPVRCLIPLGAGAITAVAVRLGMRLIQGKQGTISELFSEHELSEQLQAGPLIAKSGLFIAVLAIVWGSTVWRQKHLAALMNGKIHDGGGES